MAYAHKVRELSLSVQGHHLLMIPGGRDSASAKRLQLVEDLCDSAEKQQQRLSSRQQYGRRISPVAMVYIVDFIKLLPKELVKGHEAKELEDRCRPASNDLWYVMAVIL